jgi:cysteine dioxygenase
MRILKGKLREQRFEHPQSPGSGPLLLQETMYKEGEVTYMSDELGLHRISNPDPKSIAVSLHLYTPPNAAREGCHIFDERTGKRSHVTQSNFYSVFGCIAG